MKKFYIALSVLAVLALSVVPSSALIGIDDDVPGFQLDQAFFVVEINGSLDTAVIIQETGVVGSTTGTTANLHWHLFDRNSNHLADARVPYTRNDVEALSVRDMIEEFVTQAGRDALTTTLGGQDVYVGYIRWENEILQGANRVYANNLIGKMYLHDMPAGRAAMTNLAAREYMPSIVPDKNNALGGRNPVTGARIPFTWAQPVTGLIVPSDWLPSQGSASTMTGTGAELFADFGGVVQDPAPILERFSANALVSSAQRERGYQVAQTFTTPAIDQVADAFGLFPRFYLLDATAEDYIFLWTDQNGTAAMPKRFDVYYYDTEENPLSAPIAFGAELNILDIRTIAPPTLLTTYPAGGWISIVVPDIFGVPAPGTAYYNNFMDRDFLAYNWQFANAAGAAFNWSGLYKVARDADYRYK